MNLGLHETNIERNYAVVQCLNELRFIFTHGKFATSAVHSDVNKCCIAEHELKAKGTGFSTSEMVLGSL